MCSQLLWVLCVLLLLLEHQCLLGRKLPIPYELKAEARGWSLSVTWKTPHFSGMLQYEVEVQQTGLSAPVHHEILVGTCNLSLHVHHWEWVSHLPLNCVSHRVRIRSRDMNQTSQWSALQVTETSNVSDIFPKDEVVLAGSNVTFCCVLKEEGFDSFFFDNHRKNERWIGNHTAVIDLWNLDLSHHSGVNVKCNTTRGSKGATLFVGYPPDDSDLQCETDLQSVTCLWKKGRDTNLRGQRNTKYTLNRRPCLNSGDWCKLAKHPPSGETRWTLVAENPLGRVELNEVVDLSHRVVLQTPQVMPIKVRNSSSAVVSWNWKSLENVQFTVQCQVQLSYAPDNLEGHPLPTSPPPLRNYSGKDLRRVVLEDLLPATAYRLQLRCGKLENFWKWSSWSSNLLFQTDGGYPDTPDLWFQRNSSETVYVMWKPVSWSNGPLREYVLTWKKITDKLEQKLKMEPTQYKTTINLGNHGRHHSIRVALTAVNAVNSSSPAVVIVPEMTGGNVSPISRVTGSGGGFELSWSPHDSNTCGYVVDWYPAHGKRDVEWLKVPSGQTSARIQSASFAAGMKYILSIYTCQLSFKLLERKEGYIQELAPDDGVQNLTAIQEGADVTLSWQRVPPERCRGFLLGYIIRCNSSDVSEVNRIKPEELEYKFKGLSQNLYTFTVMAYTAGGEGVGSQISVNVVIDAHLALPMILITTAVISCLLAFLMMLCYRYRSRINVIFYSEVPQPKISSEWWTEKGVPLMVIKPCLHHQLHIMEKYGSTADLKLDAELCFPEDKVYDDHLVKKFYMQGSNSKLKPQPTPCPDSAPSDPVYPPSKAVPGDITYTRIQARVQQLDVLSQMAEPQLSPPFLGVLAASPECLGSYLPQRAAQKRPATGDHLVSPVSISSSQFLLTECESLETCDPTHPNLSSHGVPSTCCFISNPTYCATFPPQCPGSL